MKARHYFNTMFVFLVVSLAVGRVQASFVPDVIVDNSYQDIEFVSTDTLLKVQIDITQAGPYKAKLVDFQYPNSFDLLSLAIMQGETTLIPGGLWDTGSFTFNVSDTSEPLIALLQANPAESSAGLYGLQILPIPIPSAFWLFLSALTGIVTLARRGGESGMV